MSKETRETAAILLILAALFVLASIVAGPVCNHGRC